jgi:hypothetical protein
MTNGTQDWDTFSKRHVDDVVVRWPAQPPTNGSDAHKKESQNLEALLLIFNRKSLERYYN